MLFRAQTGLDRNLNYLIIAICTFCYIFLIYEKNFLSALAKIVEATNQMAAGDLDKVIDIDCKGDTKILGRQYKYYIKTLKMLLYKRERHSRQKLTL